MHFSKKILAAVLAFSLVLNFGCKPDKPENKPPPPAPVEEVAVPKFDRDSAFYFVKKQVDFGPRLPNTEGHRKTKNWLVDKLKSYGLTVIEQDFEAKAYTGTVLKSTNIIAQYKPSAGKRILLAAHWDTRHIADSPAATERQNEPIDGADDGDNSSFALDLGDCRLDFLTGTVSFSVTFPVNGGSGFARFTFPPDVFPADDSPANARLALAFFLADTPQSNVVSTTSTLTTCPTLTKTNRVAICSIGNRRNWLAASRYVAN